MAILPWRRIEKAAPPLPAGAQATQFTPEQLQGLANQLYGIGTFNALERHPIWPSVPFGPSNPLIPSAINPPGEDGRPDPRRYEFPVAWNIFVTEQRLVPWKTLRVAADQIDILRRCVEAVKAKVIGMDWDIVLAESASEEIIRGSGGDHVRAMVKAREKFNSEIARLRQFWTVPDRINGLSFDDWLVMALEELLVLDAWAIYPHPDMKGALHSLEILDASTIKPLLDDRGMRPMPPYPAYQQILYGFPRGEFLATSDDPSQDGTFSADELLYLKRNHRTWTPYGYSPVERSLPLADLYIRRQQWLRAEYTDGVLPDVMFLANENFGNTPELLRAWENIFNDDLAGQTEQRKRARIIPDGLEPHESTSAAEKFSSAFDEYVIKGIAGHFGIMPSELGYTPNSGLGGAGHQAGEAESGQILGTAPLVQWLEQQLSDISHKFLGMPRELVFQFNGGRKDENEANAVRRDTEVKGGQRTLNEARSEAGLPLIDSPVADQPMLMSGAGIFLITKEGIVSALPEPEPAPGAETPPGESKPKEDATEDQEKPSPEKEVKAFLKWVAKSQPTRDFDFTAVDPVMASALNHAAKAGGIDRAKVVARVVLGKAAGAGAPSSD